MASNESLSSKYVNSHSLTRVYSATSSLSNGTRAETYVSRAQAKARLSRRRTRYVSLRPTRQRFWKVSCGEMGWSCRFGFEEKEAAITMMFLGYNSWRRSLMVMLHGLAQHGPDVRIMIPACDFRAMRMAP